MLKAKQDQLEHRLLMLSQLIEITEESRERPFDELFFEECEPKYVYFYKIDPDKMINRETSIECYSNCLMDSLLSDNTIDLPLGTVIPQAYAINKNYRICYFFRNIYKEKNINLKKIPSGRYACLFHHGDMESHIGVFNFMIDEITKMNLKILSDVYIYDYMSYIIVGTSPDFIAKYVVKIE